MRSRALLVTALLVSLSACQQQPPPPAPAPAPTAPPAEAPRVGPVAPPTTDEGMIASAMSAAPESVSKEATVIAMNEKMETRTLRQGTNGWTCLPDSPSPGVDPMCLDKNAMEWMGALVAHKDPPANKMGFIYMLMGGSDASNTDPHATGPKPGAQWVDTGPHVMVMNIGNKFEGYPTTPDNPKAPFVMWANTPYAHLMIPVK